MIVEGQIHGGVAQGVGGALLEEMVYDEQGQLLTGTFMDYLVPTAMELPPIETVHLEYPSPRNPLGVKGIGEGGAISPPAAIANAVEDALAPFGVRVTRTPSGPSVVLESHRGRRGEKGVKPAPFEYVRPASAAEAVDALGAITVTTPRCWRAARASSPCWPSAWRAPRLLVDINRCEDLDEPSEGGGVAHRRRARPAARSRALGGDRAALSWPRCSRLSRTRPISNRGHRRGKSRPRRSRLRAARAVPVPRRRGHGATHRRRARHRRGPSSTWLRSRPRSGPTSWPRRRASRCRPPGAGWGFAEVARRHGDFALVGCIAVLALR